MPDVEVLEVAAVSGIAIDGWRYESLAALVTAQCL